MRSFGIIILFFWTSLLSIPGSVVSFFQVPNPDNTTFINGLARDPDDGNLWVSYTPALDRCLYCKINSISHMIIQPWREINFLHQNSSLGFGYFWNGVKNLVFYDLDQYAIHLNLVNPANGSFNGTLPNPDAGQLVYGIDVYDITDQVYCRSTDNAPVRRSNYPATNWYDLNLSFSVSNTLGLATGWNRLFTVNSFWNPYIWQYHISNGEFQTEIYLFGIPPYLTCHDIAIGRENVVGDHESLFVLASDYQHASISGIYEIEIGDVAPGVSISPTSLGSIKASFR